MNNITILTPTWNRSKFLPLYVRNLKIQEYPHEKIEVIIDDDGTDKFIKNKDELKQIQEYLFPMKLRYIDNKPKRSIGKKRNDLIKESKSKIFAFMDDDDIYLPTYLSYSYQLLKENNAGCVGSNKMIFTMSEKDFEVYAIDCGENKALIHEACLMMTMKFFKSSCKFENSSEGEGKSIFYGLEKNPKIIISDILKCMVCLQHDGNTIDKMRFATPECKTDIQLTSDLIKMIKNILKK